MTLIDLVNPGESYGPLLMSPFKSTSISLDEGIRTEGETQMQTQEADG
jgi:hypothetical protein